VPGRHTVYNALAATIIALCYVIPIEEIVLLLESFKGVERRLQILYQKEFTLIDDHISDEDNTRKMLEALVLMTAGLPVHIIYAVRGNRGVQVNREVIAQFAKYRESINWKNFIVTDSVDVARKRDMVLPEEGQAVLEDLKAAGYEVEYQAELRSAIEKLMPLVGEGEFFVLAGSHNMDKGGRIALELLAEGRAESEREAILKILEDRVMG
jgi:UDP-N-acetylmuramoyl-L-alanyl-D-glutamate--2,6-diaminopimelate ligase